MNNGGKGHKNSAERTIIILFIILFFISFINSYRLLAITSVAVVIYSIIFCSSKILFKIIKSIIPFTFLLLLPSFIRYVIIGEADIDFTGMIICKIIISALILGTIISRYSPLYLVEGILNLGFPQIFNKIFALTFRYFHMINEDVQKGRKALSSRGIDERKGFSSLSIYGDWVAGFFLKSSQHSDMVFNAMRSRGFQGMPRNDNVKDKRLLVESCMLIVILVAVLIIDGKV